MFRRILPRAIFALAMMLTVHGGALAKNEWVNVPDLVVGYHNAQNDCDIKYSRYASGKSLNYLKPKAKVFGRLDKRRFMFGLFCSIGAYNTVYAIYVTGKSIRGGVERLAFGYPDETGKWKKMTSPMNVEYDRKARILTAHPYGRGLGDCYADYKYKWSPRRGIFILLEYWLDDECDGKMNARLIYRHRSLRK